MAYSSTADRRPSMLARTDPRPHRARDRAVLGPARRAHQVGVEVVPVRSRRIDRIQKLDVLTDGDLELTELIRVADATDQHAARWGATAVLVDALLRRALERDDSHWSVAGIAHPHSPDLDDTARRTGDGRFDALRSKQSGADDARQQSCESANNPATSNLASKHFLCEGRGDARVFQRDLHVISFLGQRGRIRSGGFRSGRDTRDRLRPGFVSDT
jgi:hypothetical protein